ncbi:DNA mismatch repair protein MutL [Oceanobacillus oncorhynchi subsp. incaldanensis]|uniref:DNA mismatch repair endonuclease MutL n=1 Tax=Oceanobacillus oncorhynchi TaxID=545501 RepID=UPI001B099C0B|nr:DNA mismatch repair endonuclease MutL [Oceanobacillus oncorhynchi]GIO19717.1 DNA mismatch repair protein MutL [Oceanobacillus oncorhynchi subsp. incaldanensis]
MPIQQMPDSLANKIAAGEVVERPASVVKEIIENSIDAGATWIRIDVHEAGLSEIRIVDNGAGIAAEDVEKAFLPHATSKISTETDLFHVTTLGFRGEALASIASVSRLSIQTSQGDVAGVSLELEGGEVVKRGKSDARQGTEIVVSDLFYNTPARLKYMKSLHTELGHISDVLNRMALAHPEIRFEATHNGKGLLKTSGNDDMLQVISQVYGMSVAKQMSPVEHKTLDFTITGYIAKPEVTRASRNYMSTIINGRFVRNIALNKAIIEGYHTLLPIGRSPIVVLSIEMDSILVDVNVHPAKLEVRFSKEKELYVAVKDMIQAHFRKMTLIPEVTKKPEPKQKSEQHTFQFETEPASPFQEKEKKIEAEKPSDAVIREDNRYQEEEPAFLREENTHIEVQRREQESAPAPEGNVSEELIMDAPVPPIEKASEQVQPRVPMMYPIGQLQGTYIMAQNENGLYMVDQHAAQERVKYEFFKQKLGKPINKSQELLIPLTFDFSKKEAIFIEEAKDTLEKAGLFFEPFGHQTYVIRSHPTWFPAGLEEEIIREMVEQFIQESTVNVEKIREEAAILMSCKRSIKANHYLTSEEMFQLLEDLRSTTDPFTCPHGRPIIVHFSTYELEKMFKRIM